MRLALLGNPVRHSASPALYRRLLGSELEAYDLIEVLRREDLPTLTHLAQSYHGINLTTPYKQSFLHDVLVHDPVAQALGAINTIDLRSRPFLATNTDAVAARFLLLNYCERWGKIRLLILGDGVMARLMVFLAQELSLPYEVLSRRKGNLHAGVLETMVTGQQTIVVNCCSRDFIFNGPIHDEHIFWDLNYALPAHAHLQSKVKTYLDGQEMLELQAKWALDFWGKTYS